jgi:hypothetical protein
VRDNTQARLSNTSGEGKKRVLHNFEDLPLEDLLNDNVGFDSSKHVPSNPNRTTIVQNQTSQVIPGTTNTTSELKAVLESTKDTVQTKLNNMGYDLGIRGADNQLLGDSLRSQAHNAKQVLRSSFEYPSQLRTPLQSMESQNYRGFSTSQPIYRIANQVVSESGKQEEKKNLFASISGLVSSNMFDKINTKVAKAGVDISDGGVVLVASCVMTAMMLIVFWLLIRQ